jgi:hypothetical protein
LWVSPKEVNKQISLDEFNETIGVVGVELKKDATIWKLPSWLRLSTHNKESNWK